MGKLFSIWYKYESCSSEKREIVIMDFCVNQCVIIVLHFLQAPPFLKSSKQYEKLLCHIKFVLNIKQKHFPFVPKWLARI